MTRRIRVAAWVVLVALAAAQAYAQRFSVGPDGVSYLELSDAVTTGDWRRLLDLYWSPVYPVLIGIGRAITGAGPRLEIPVIHAVNLVGFVALLAAFEYMLSSILSLAAGVRHSMLGGRFGVATAYGLFGVLALTMIPLELTTPDLFSGAAMLLAFGAMLRLRQPTAGLRPAVILGAALGLGALTKSFLVPWSLVCFACVAIALGRKGTRVLAASVGVWLVFVLPWSVALSIKAGRPTFGDAGRLTYGWYVNLQDAPSMGGVPPGARTATTDKILPGVGVPGDSPNADPMWADPARFNTSIRPHFDLGDQAKTLKVFHVFYVENLSPLLFLIFLIATAPRGTRRRSWQLGWLVYAPAAAGMIAYAAVLVTTRYVMPFVLAVTLVILATIPLARRLVPMYALLGLVIPIGLEAVLPETSSGLTLVMTIVAGVVAAVLVPSRRRAAWVAVAVAALFISRVLLATPLNSLSVPAALIGVIGCAAFVRPPRRAMWAILGVLVMLVLPTVISVPSALLRLGAAALALVYWRLAFGAVHTGRPIWFAQRTQAALGFLLFAVFVFRLDTRYDQDRLAFDRAIAPGWGNVPWNISRELASHGIGPGTRIAVIGPHAESYWARTGRLHIVADVPRNRATIFWMLPKASQDALLDEFRKAGATVAIATMGPLASSPDSTWIPVKYNGWIRPLAERR